MAATRLTFDTVLPNLLSVNELRVARDLLAGLARRTKLPARFFGASESGGRERVTGVLPGHFLPGHLSNSLRRPTALPAKYARDSRELSARAPRYLERTEVLDEGIFR